MQTTWEKASTIKILNWHTFQSSIEIGQSSDLTNLEEEKIHSKRHNGTLTKTFKAHCSNSPSMQRPLFSHMINNFDGPRFSIILCLNLTNRLLHTAILLDQVLIAVFNCRAAVSFAKLYSTQKNQRLLIHSTNTVCPSSIHPPEEDDLSKGRRCTRTSSSRPDRENQQPRNDIVPENPNRLSHIHQRGCRCRCAAPGGG